MGTGLTENWKTPKTVGFWYKIKIPNFTNGNRQPVGPDSRPVSMAY
jgi:hypothetical protein